MIVLYILIAILIFGFLIFVHELGHYLTARLFSVKIYEFSIGMGPKLLSKTSKKTGIAYSLRLLPIGGFVSMAGEDAETDEPDALNKKPVWQRIVVTAAGAFMNLFVGLLVMLLITATSKSIASTTIHSFVENATSCECGENSLLPKDKILRVGNRRTHISYDVGYNIMRKGTEPIDILVLRDGEEVLLSGVVFPTIVEQGITWGSPDYYVYAKQKTVGTVLSESFWYSVSMVRMVYDSLYDLITGRYGLEALSGPVGITEVISDSAATAVKTKDASALLLLIVLLAVNLGVMNLLPLPALDGGRIVFMLIEGIFGKPINRNVEGYIHTVGMAILLLLMLFITVKDVFKLFG